MNADYTDQKQRLDKNAQKRILDKGGQKQIHGKHDGLTERVIGVFFDVYNELGYGFLESVYR
jgi:hypothetical protein